MSHTVPSQHPAVVLRSNYLQLRALLAIALIAIIGLTLAVVVLATNSSSSSTTASSASHQSAAQPILPRASSRVLRTYSRPSAPVLPKTARYSNAEMDAYARDSSVTAPAIRVPPITQSQRAWRYGGHY
jgi:hypothetical protein